MVYAVGVGIIFASQFHLLSHAVFKALLFLGAGAVIHTIGTRDMRYMGGLGRSMPLVRAVFVIGALALAGLPITNGFFSKELVLEGGSAYGPLWAYIGMLVGAGLTAMYSLRMVAMVFYGKTKVTRPIQDASPAMRVSLSLLAVGTLSTWLLAGPFSHLLADSLPYHNLHAEKTTTIVTEIVTAPATWLALAIIALGMAAWLIRDRLAGVTKLLSPVTNFAAAGLGFEWLNRQITCLTMSVATALSRTQTGQLNWNIAGIVGGLVLILAILVWGA